MRGIKKLTSLGLVGLLFSMSVFHSNAFTLERIQGKNKYETAGLIADKQQYTTAILINADSTMSDGLSASGLAGVNNAPILLTQKNNIPKETLERVEKAEKVYIIGGENSIDKSIEDILKDKGIEIKRLQGSDRIKTSYSVAKEINSIKKVNTIMLTNAFKGEADAMSIAPVAIMKNAPIILTNGRTIPFKFDKNIKSYVVGGSENMTDDILINTNSQALGGADRYATNRKVIQTFYRGEEEFYIASGTDLVYPLIASTIVKDKPIVLVNESNDKRMLKRASKITVVGNLDESIIKKCLDAKDGKSETKTKKEKVYVEGFGWIEPGEGEGEVVDSDGDFNKIVADM
ncbi:TPA: cell wall-binding repeat-containing protein [Clostridioides difficile]|uniref:cell wall-binding repeat-containing protein n=5 Tax=Clostridioides difficile TaxID=1496 RepID=UPI0010BA8CD5|nr:cell wall-binding repeat-containing protein [Clostridioides difficile]MDN9069314.1 cell wall-binding repeat-containing protein [Clostridioides difficile]VII72037.1 cell surface protein [Clostridioides difficile]HBE8855030.1 cell wall-binding repeat-containing protein [Clostridioides difficile]HBF3270046.1 cell wall-binding repeat-containing protein [Clostridioides difficile]